MRLELLADLLLQGDARVEHHAQQADQLQVAVQVGVNLLDGVGQIGQAFEREVFALHGHDHALRGAQAVEGEHAQRWRAVDQHEVVVAIDGGQRVLQAALAALFADQFDLGTGQLAVGAQHGVGAAGVFQLVGHAGGFGDAGRFQQHVVHRQRHRPLVDARAHGGVALRVEVDHQHALADLGQAGGQVDGGRRLADAALLVGNAENMRHGVRVGADVNRFTC